MKAETLIYAPRPAAGNLVEGHGPEAPELWICRRLDDYPEGRKPDGGALGWCTACGVPVIYNPDAPVAPDLPRVCLQCVGIEPLPFLPFEA